MIGCCLTSSQQYNRTSLDGIRKDCLNVFELSKVRAIRIRSVHDKLMLNTVVLNRYTMILYLSTVTASKYSCGIFELSTEPVFDCFYDLF